MQRKSAQHNGLDRALRFQNLAARGDDVGKSSLTLILYPYSKMNVLIKFLLSTVENIKEAIVPRGREFFAPSISLFACQKKMPCKEFDSSSTPGCTKGLFLFMAVRVCPICICKSKFF